MSRERLLQFGTGRFLLGFLGDFVDRAADGGVVIVQSTGADRASLINEQSGQYTLVVRGLRDGEAVEEVRVLSHVSRALAADHDWEALVEIARSPDLEVVVSNTTEAGLRLDPADRRDMPVSFPAKLTALLVERFAAGRDGLVVLPCELVEHNGALLLSHVRALGAAWRLGSAFDDWIVHACAFPNTLVDRIVTGVPGPEDMDRLRTLLTFDDMLVTVAEPYALWAIEGDEALRARIWFAGTNPAIRFVPDLDRFRTLKVHLLNGGHSATAALAMLCGFRTVGEMLRDGHGGDFIEGVLRDEIGPALPYPADEVRAYIDTVIERWRNPYLEHAWSDIAFSYSAKLRVRIAPVVARVATPRRLALGFAAYLAWVRDTPQEIARDPNAPALLDEWAMVGDAPDRDELSSFARRVLGRADLWGVDLTQAEAFMNAVVGNLWRAREGGFWSLVAPSLAERALPTQYSPQA